MKEVDDKVFNPLGKRFTQSILEPSDRDKKLLFWFLSLVIVPVLSQTYGIVMTFGIGGAFFLLHKEMPDFMVAPLLATSVFFAIGTYFWLWRAFKKNYLNKPKEEQKMPNQAL